MLAGFRLPWVLVPVIPTFSRKARDVSLVFCTAGARAGWVDSLSVNAIRGIRGDLAVPSYSIVKYGVA